MNNFSGDGVRQTGGMLVVIIGGVTLVGNFMSKTLKEITVKLNTPMVAMKDQLDNIEKHVTKTTTALLTMQRNSLLRSCEECLSRGYATLEQKETIAEQYRSYHELNGNSFITDMVHQVTELPLKASDVVDNRDEAVK